jgi:hypothetical protein
MYCHPGQNALEDDKSGFIHCSASKTTILERLLKAPEGPRTLRQESLQAV